MEGTIKSVSKASDSMSTEICRHAGFRFTRLSEGRCVPVFAIREQWQSVQSNGTFGLWRNRNSTRNQIGRELCWASLLRAAGGLRLNDRFICESKWANKSDTDTEAVFVSCMDTPRIFGGIWSFDWLAGWGESGKFVLLLPSIEMVALLLRRGHSHGISFSSSSLLMRRTSRRWFVNRRNP